MINDKSVRSELDPVYILQVSFKVLFVLEHPRANVTLEGLDVTNTVNCRQVFLHITSIQELPAANFALVFGVRMLGWRPSSPALSMCRVIMSIDR